MPLASLAIADHRVSGSIPQHGYVRQLPPGSLYPCLCVSCLSRLALTSPLCSLFNCYVLATNELCQLITLLFHQGACLCLDVQAQQGFRVGGAYIEPPVTIVNRDTIEVIDRACVFTEMLLNGFQLALDIVDMGVDLPTAYPRIQRLDQFSE